MSDGTQKPQCKTCQSFHRLDELFGECRAYAPTAFKPDRDSPWPRIKESDWCLEHEEKQ